MVLDDPINPKQKIRIEKDRLAIFKKLIKDNKKIKKAKQLTTRRKKLDLKI